MTHAIRAILGIAAFAALAAPVGAAEESYPSRTVRIVVPTAAGGPSDRAARLIAGEARSLWEHSIPPVEALRYSVTFRSLKKRRSQPNENRD